MKKSRPNPSHRSTVRRSFALPQALVDRVLAATPPEARGNLNGVVKEALAEYVARREGDAFADEMSRMAVDPQIRAECAAIEVEFAPALLDGLSREGRSP